MTIEGLAYRNCHPCARCGASGEQVWLRATDDLCLECRGKDVPVTTELATPESHGTTLANYLSDDARAFVIETQEQAQIAADLLNDIRHRRTTLQAAERDMLEDFVNGIEKIKDRFRPLHQAAEAAYKLWLSKIQESERRRREETTKALLDAQQATQVNDRPAVQAAMIRIQPVEKLQGVTKRKIWKYKITNEAELPRDYLVVNTALLQRLATSSRPEIPGVEFYQEEILAATG